MSNWRTPSRSASMLFCGLLVLGCGDEETAFTLTNADSDDSSDTAADDSSSEDSSTPDPDVDSSSSATDTNDASTTDQGGGSSGDDTSLDAVEASRPSRLSEHGSAYVEAAGGMLIFGGNRGIPLNCDLPPANLTDEAWLFLDTPGKETWQRIEGDLPPARSRHMMAASEDEAWVFGGRFRENPESGSYTLYNDLWEFDADSKSFSPATVSGPRPAARVNGSLCYDENRDELWLYGGNDSTSGSYNPLADVWRFSFESDEWEQVELDPDEGPGPRLFHSAICDSERDQMVVFGGADDIGFTNLLGLAEVWALDLDELTWERLADAEGPPTSPDGRFWQGMVWDRADDVYLLFGGHDDTALGNRNDLWFFDPEDNSWSQSRDGDELNSMPNAVCDFPPDFTLVDYDSPERRNSHAFVWSPQSQSALMFAGKTDCGVTDDVWQLKNGDWSNLLVARQGEICARVLGDPELCNAMCL